MSEAQSNVTFANPISVIVMGGVQGTSCILLNGISLLMIFKNQEIPGRVKACFTGQVITDLAVGVSTIMMILDNFEGVYCYISLYMNMVFGAITSFMALLQTVDRFLVLRITYAYTAWMSKKKMAAIVVILYVICSAAILGTLYQPVTKGKKCFPTISGGRYGYVLFMTITFFCSFSIICMYIYIGIKVRRLQKFSAAQERIQSRLQTNRQHLQVNDFVDTGDKIPADTNIEQTQVTRIEATTQKDVNKKVSSEGLFKNAIVPENTTTPKRHNEPVAEMKPRNSSELANDMKVLITMILTASLYGICYLPLSIVSVFVEVNWETREDFIAEHSQILTACGVLFTSNSLLNPLVYIWRLKSFRVNCRKMCCKT